MPSSPTPPPPPSTPPPPTVGTDLHDVTSGLEKVCLNAMTPETAVTEAVVTTPWSSPPRSASRSSTASSPQQQQQTPVRSLVLPPSSVTMNHLEQRLQQHHHHNNDEEDSSSLSLPRRTGGGGRTEMESPLRNPFRSRSNHGPPLPRTPGRWSSNHNTSNTTTATLSNTTTAAPTVSTPTRHYERTPVIRNGYSDSNNNNNNINNEAIIGQDDCDHPLALPSDWDMLGGGTVGAVGSRRRRSTRTHDSWLVPATTTTTTTTADAGHFEQNLSHQDTAGDGTRFTPAVPLPEAGKFYTFTSRNQYELQQQEQLQLLQLKQQVAPHPESPTALLLVQPYQPNRDDWSDCGVGAGASIPKEELDRIFSTRPITTTANGGSNMSTSTCSTNNTNNNNNEENTLMPSHMNPWLFQQLSRTIPLEERDFSIPSLKLAQQLPAGEESVTSYYSYTDDEDDDSLLSYESNLFRNHSRRNSSLWTDDDGDDVLLGGNIHNNSNQTYLNNNNNNQNDDDESLLTTTSSYTHTTHTNTDTNNTHHTTTGGTPTTTTEEQVALNGVGISMSGMDDDDETDDVSSLLSNRMMMMAMQDDDDDDDGSWQQQRQERRSSSRELPMQPPQNMDIMMLWNDAQSSQPHQLPFAHVPDLPQVRLAARTNTISSIMMPLQDNVLRHVPIDNSNQREPGSPTARRDRRRRQRENRRRGRRQRAQQRALDEQQRELGAWEWLRTVQADQHLVAEAASSKFLRQGAEFMMMTTSQEFGAAHATPYPIQKRQLSAAVVETRTFCLDAVANQQQLLANQNRAVSKLET